MAIPGWYCPWKAAHPLLSRAQARLGPLDIAHLPGGRSLPARGAQSSMVEVGSEDLVLEEGPQVFLETSSLVAVGCQHEGKTYSSFKSVFPGRQCRVRGHIPPNSTWPLQVTQVDKNRSFKGPKERPSQFSSWQQCPGPLFHTKAPALWSGHGECRPREPSCLSRGSLLGLQSGDDRILRGHRFPHCSTGGNWSTSPTSVLSCSPRAKVSLYRSLAFSCDRGTVGETITSRLFVLGNRL